MKVKLLIARAGLNFSQNAGQEIEVSDDEAKRLIESGQAEPVRTAQKENTAKKPKAEKAVK